MKEEVMKEAKQTHKQTIYIAPKSTHESRRITALESVRGLTSSTCCIKTMKATWCINHSRWQASRLFSTTGLLKDGALMSLCQLSNVTTQSTLVTLWTSKQIPS